jgi:hypothetical protein
MGRPHTVLTTTPIHPHKTPQIPIVCCGIFSGYEPEFDTKTLLPDLTPDIRLVFKIAISLATISRNPKTG